MSFFIATALAEGTTAATTAQASSPWGSVFMLVAFVGIFYFLLWRPQSKRAKEHKNLIANISKGDEVVTTGGMVGKIVQVEDSYVLLTVATNVDIRVQKGSIQSVLPKGSLKAE